MSMPASCMTARVSGWMPFGSTPALNTSRPAAAGAIERVKASAIWLRAELPVHR